MLRLEAAKLLDVKDDADKKTIEKKYYGLYKRYKNNNNRNPFEDKEFQDIIEAYNILMGYEVKPEEEKPPKKIYGKLGLDQKKTENFLHYYKVHIIIGIIILIGGFLTIKDIVNNIPSELEITVMGDIYIEDVEVLKDKIMTEMDYLPEIGIVHVILSDKIAGEQQYAYQMKAQIQFAAANVDIYIVDEENYKKYASMGAFKRIDDIELESGIKLEKSKYLEVSLDETGEIDVFGVDITNSILLEDLQSVDGKLIAAFGFRSEYPENAIKLLELILDEIK